MVKPRPTSSAPELWSSTETSSFRRALLTWYHKHARPLPWRQTHDPYRIWISEIMLQQTTVVAVIPYFERFLTRFPTLNALAASDEQDVLRLWEGLGYYSRGRNLLKAAKTLVAEHHGEFPRDVHALQQLAGIGRYTAGAIASFAFDLRAPIVEANTQRLYARLTGITAPLASTPAQRQLWDFAAAILPPQKGSGELNQALMELGAKICTPANPLCDKCPVAKFCTAFRQGLQNQIPTPKLRPAITAVHEYALVLTHKNKILLRQRQPDERWAGLWDFPRLQLTDQEKSPHASLSTLQDLLRDQSQLHAQLQHHVASLKHSVTRFRITLDIIAGELTSQKLPPQQTWKSCAVSDLDSLPLSMPGRKIAKLLALDAHKPHRKPR